MCSDGILSKITKVAGCINKSLDVFRNIYCKYAISCYNNGNVRIVQVPMLSDSIDEDDKFVEYETVELMGLDPEIYYFFRHYNNSEEDFNSMLEYCGLTRKDKYTATTDTGEVGEFIFEDGKLMFAIFTV